MADRAEGYVWERLHETLRILAGSEENLAKRWERACQYYLVECLKKATELPASPLKEGLLELGKEMESDQGSSLSEEPDMMINKRLDNILGLYGIAADLMGVADW